MIKYFLIIFVLTITTNVKADFVDIATVKINNKLVRKLTNNSQTPYLINFNKYKIGDTLNIEIWTDHGGEKNFFVTIRNMESNHIDTLNKKNNYILTKDFIEKVNLISVTYIYDYPKEMKVIWDVFKSIPNNKVDLIYTSINNLRDFLLSDSPKKTAFFSNNLQDSIEVNFKTTPSKIEFPKREIRDNIKYSTDFTSNLLILNKNEVSFLSHFNSVDYVQMYDDENNIFGSIKVEENYLNSFRVSFGDYTYKLEFYFIYQDHNYKLEKIFLKNN